MDIIDYINTKMRIAESEDEAIKMLDTMCSATYSTDSPVKDYNIIRERFGVDAVLVGKTLVFNVTKEMVDLVENDTLESELDMIGLEINRFEI